MVEIGITIGTSKDSIGKIIPTFNKKRTIVLPRRGEYYYFAKASLVTKGATRLLGNTFTGSTIERARLKVLTRITLDLHLWKMLGVSQFS